MERIIERCAGLDVHKSSVTACVRISHDENEALHQEIREFATTTLEGCCCSEVGWLPLR